MRALRGTAFVVVVNLCAGGCTHITTKVPGVLDLRSDGSLEEKAKKPDAPRGGLDGLLWGSGVTGDAAVVVEDRKYWIVGLVPVFNESATEEIAQALGGKALASPKIGERYALADVGLSFCGALIPCGVCLVEPWEIPGSPRDVLFSGVRIDVAPQGMPPAPPADAVPNPAPGGAP